MVVVGGLGNIHGAILGAAIIIILPEFGRAWEQYRLAGYGIFLVLLMIFMPRGLSSLLALITATVIEKLRFLSLPKLKASSRINPNENKSL